MQCFRYINSHNVNLSWAKAIQTILSIHTYYHIIQWMNAVSYNGFVLEQKLLGTSNQGAITASWCNAHRGNFASVTL